MLIVLFIVSIILSVFLFWLFDIDGIPFIFIFPIICMFFIFGNIYVIVNGRVVDQKIEMYSEENKVIETQIETVVTDYMKYESETLKDLKGNSAITLVSLYPELKADELVKTQIKTYQENNSKIKKLKEEKIDISVAKWWLYFGK